MIQSRSDRITGMSHDWLHRIAGTITSKARVERMPMHVASTFPDNYIYGKYNLLHMGIW